MRNYYLVDKKNIFELINGFLVSGVNPEIQKNIFYRKKSIKI